MKRINYITNLSVREFSGGWSGMNRHIYLQLKRHFSINLVENINPPYSFADRLGSKLLRITGIKGNFTAFTSKRLNWIKKEAESKMDTQANLNFFHGATPWLHITNMQPYALYLDACFATYMKVYHKQSKFNRSQLNALFKREAGFLNSAQAVFFSSNWAKEDAQEIYSLDGRNLFVAGLGGAFDIPITSYNNDTPYFLFIATDFLGKGGDMVVNAFCALSKSTPGYKLLIAGQKPPVEYLKRDGVEYMGFLNKSNMDEYSKLIGLFLNAYCFLLPTSKDMTPLVLLEAASAGCPVITTNVYGISEIVKHNQTGFLLNPDSQLEKNLERCMLLLCKDLKLRNKMGYDAWHHVNSNFSWNKVGSLIVGKLSSIHQN